MKDDAVFDRLFGASQHTICIDGFFLSGTAQVGDHSVSVMGTWYAAPMDGDLALAIAGEILRVIDEDTGKKPRPIIFIADTQGQALSRHEELLGLNGYFAHVARCVDLARRSGHAMVTLIHGEAVSGGFLAYGMLADKACAMPGAQVRVMDLRAMSRVTKIDFERLQTLATESPVFAPGADNYWRMGAITEVWEKGDQDWRQRLATVLIDAINDDKTDRRNQLGEQRGGRTLAAKIGFEVSEK
jgi:malonate decarboxylase gamma subunit